MNQKFELTEDVRILDGKRLRRVRALRNFGSIQKGEVGGWVEKEENLSDEDWAWISDDAMVTGNARVQDDAKVFGCAEVSHNAIIQGRAYVSGYAVVNCNAVVTDNAYVREHAVISGNARIAGNVRIMGETKVVGDALIREKEDLLVISRLGSRLDTITFYRDISGRIFVKCGCFIGDIDKFTKEVKKTHRRNKFAKEYALAAKLAKVHMGGGKNESLSNRRGDYEVNRLRNGRNIRLGQAGRTERSEGTENRKYRLIHQELKRRSSSPEG